MVPFYVALYEIYNENNQTVTYNERYHNIYLQWTITMTSTYKGRLPKYILTMNGYHNIYLQWTITITSTYNGRLPKYILTMNGYHSIYLQWMVTITSSLPSIVSSCHDNSSL
jgi:hypothetical protein